jgi:hypothetical protein
VPNGKFFFFFLEKRIAKPRRSGKIAPPNQPAGEVVLKFNLDCTA